VSALVQRGHAREAAAQVAVAAALRCGQAVRLLVRVDNGWHVEAQAGADGSARAAQGDALLGTLPPQRLCTVSADGDAPLAAVCADAPVAATCADLAAPLLVVALALANAGLQRTIARRESERRAAETEGLRVQSALRESESRFRRMAESTQDVIWITEVAPERVIYVSPGFERIWGHRPDALYADPHLWVKGIHPDDQQHVGESFAAWIVDSGERPWVGEFRVVHPSGQVRWILDRGAKSLAGGTMRVSGISTDITERRCAEQALAASQERFALAMDAARDGHWDWVIASDDFYASERMLEIYGFPPGHRFRGRADFLGQFPFLPGERERWRAEFGAYLQGRDTHFELTLGLLRAGEVRYARLHGLVTRDAAGQPMRWTGSVRDVTEQRERELALRLSEERFALAVAASNDGIWDWDSARDTVFLSERALRLFGLAPAASADPRPLARWLAEVRWHPADAEDHRIAVTHYVDGRLPAYDGEWRVRQADGEYRWIRIRGQCVRDADGRPLRMAGSVSDVDVRRRTETALRQAQRLEAVGTLAGGIAHDFNNILGAILGFTELGVADTRAGGRARRDIELIGKAAERGRALVERLLAFGRTGASEHVPVRLDAVVADALQLLASTLHAAVRLETALHAAHATALCDPTQLHQVAMNLLTNAAHALPRGGSLRVSTQARRLDAPRIATLGELGPGDWVMLAVEDSGEGIAPEVLPRIFDPFFSTREVGLGAGLGLSLVHGIVTEHHGAVVVETQPGAGSSFQAWFRRGPDQPAAAISPPPGRAGQGRGRVLVVDDDDLVLEVLVDALARAGFEPSGFASAQEALAAFAAAPRAFAAVVTDGRMPGMTGFALIAALRRLRAAVPVVLVTGYLGADADADLGPEHAADAILRKPVALRQLVEVVARLVDAGRR
jgi:PAS domain S-box-containing protein